MRLLRAHRDKDLVGANAAVKAFPKLADFCTVHENITSVSEPAGIENLLAELMGETLQVDISEVEEDDGLDAPGKSAKINRLRE